LQFFLAEALKQGDQGEAEKTYLAIIHVDASETERSIVALNRLVELLIARKDELAALNCLTAATPSERGLGSEGGKVLPKLIDCASAPGTGEGLETVCFSLRSSW
jgi:hypothetical protein